MTHLIGCLAVIILGFGAYVVPCLMLREESAFGDGGSFSSSVPLRILAVLVGIAIMALAAFIGVQCGLPSPPDYGTRYGALSATCVVAERS